MTRTPAPTYAQAAAADVNFQLGVLNRTMPEAEIDLVQETSLLTTLELIEKMLAEKKLRKEQQR